MKTRLSFLLLALGACTAPTGNPDSMVTGLQGGNNILVEPTSYEEWVDGLPILSLDSMAFRTSAQGKIAMKVQEDGMEMNIDVQLGVKLDYLDLRHFREDIWVHVDLPEIPEFTGFETLKFGIKILADGKTLFLSPEFQDDLLGAQVKASGLGIEDTTLTLDIKLFEDMMKLYWRVFEDGDVDLSSFLPDGMSVDEFFERGLNPAGWARAYMLTSEILEFQVDSNEVRIKARMKDELLGSALLFSPEQNQQLDNLTYEMSFDRYSGLPTSLALAMEVDDMVSMVFELDFAEFEMGADLFEANAFNSAHLDQKHMFPVDTFIQMALASMQATMADDDGDMAF